MKIKLTDKRVAALPTPNTGQSFHWDSDDRGFGVRIIPSGTKSWIVQGMVNGKTRRVTVGRCDRLPCRYTNQDGVEDGARIRAKSLLLEIETGRDPQEEKRKKQSQTETLREVMEDYLLNKRTKHGPLRPKTKHDIRQCVEKHFSDWADKPVSTIRRDACVQKFRKMSERAPVLANQVFRNLRALLNWAREKSATEDGVYTVLPVNPVAHMLRSGGLVKWNVEKPRTTRIQRGKIGEVWNAINQLSDPEQNVATTCASSDLIAFMLLTGARLGESCSLRWDCINLATETPTVHFSADVTKNHNALTLPVSAPLRAVLNRRLDARKNGNQYVFPAARNRKSSDGGPTHIKDPRAAIRAITKESKAQFTPHALRRTFDDIGQIVGVGGDQRRQLLNHLANDVHGVNYSNDPDPATLMPAMENIGSWVIEQGDIATASKANKIEGNT